jgi:hypothetical protein
MSVEIRERIHDQASEVPRLLASGLLGPTVHPFQSRTSQSPSGLKDEAPGAALDQGTGHRSLGFWRRHGFGQ